MKRSCFLPFFAVLLMAVHCDRTHRTEQNLSESDLACLRSIRLLESEERVILFESAGLKESGALLTNSCISYYWLEKSVNEISSAPFALIDSMKAVNNSRTLTYASYIEVFCSDQLDFKVYMDVDSTRLYTFFQTAEELWKQNR